MENADVWLLSLDEFGYMHEQLQNCITKGETAKCEFPGLNSATITITPVFLSQFASNMTVVFAARHTKENLSDPNSEYYKFIEKSAAWSISQEKAENLVKLTKTSANLMLDKYSESFKADFAQYYGEEEGHTATETQELAKSVANWTFSQEAIETVGKHEILLAYSWNSKASRRVQITFTAPKKPKNEPHILYSLPFDASLRELNSESRDYGVGISGNGSDQFYLTANAAKRVNALGAGSKQFSFQYNKSNTADSQKGRIINLTGENIQFSPTTPYSISMTVAGTNNAVLFNFSEPTLNGTIQWDRLIEGKGSENKVCQNGKGDTQYSLLQQNGKGMIFLSESVGSTALELVCSPKGANAELKQGTLFWSNANATQTANTAKQTRGSLGLSPQPNANKPFNLKDLAEAIKNNAVCVSVTTNSLVLAWNPDYFLRGGQ